MTYAGVHGDTAYAGETLEFGSRELFERADAVFYGWNTPLHGTRPFERIFPYGRYRDHLVLEVGCGMGCMAMNWAREGARVTAVDLTPAAVTQTRRRLELFGLAGAVMRADGRSLPFQAGTFDYAYSWGVLHHSPELNRSLDELMRVLKPGGGFGIMLYHRHSFLYAYMVRFLEGFLHCEDRFLDPVALASRYGDGAREEGNPHTWPITRGEARAMLGRHSRDLEIDVLGTDLDSVFTFLIPGLGMRLPRWFMKPWARRFGWSLWIHGHKD